jgi:hypothetical protein
MNTPFTLTIDQPLLTRLEGHLFPGDGDEHGAVIAAGIVETPRGARLLAREVFLAEDGVDYVPGTRGYRALTPAFVAGVSDYCAREKLCYLAVHCHGGRDAVSFSSDDLASHQRGYPALLDITGGGPVGALVFARNAVAGEIWTREGVFPLAHTTVVGPHIRRLYPAPPARPRHADPTYDRHARLFGDLGQAILGNLKVGIIGLGGGGSLLNEWLARLGVGHIVAIDFDRIERTNLPRVVGTNGWDRLWATLAAQKQPWLQACGKRLSPYKVHVAQRVARQANPRIRYDAVVGDVVDEATARLLVDCNFLFLATDSMQSRAVFNAVVHQFMVPGAQIGAKVSVRKDGQIGDIFAATRLVLPHAEGGCLQCHELISAARLQEEALSEQERRAQRYVEHDEVSEPSVITLNALSAAQAANDLMMLFTGLYHEDAPLHHQINMARERQIHTYEPRRELLCLDCSNSPKSRRARGGRKRLPCRV